MSDRIRWGILSTGAIAATFAEDLKLLPDAELAAVGSRTAESAERFAAAHGVARAHGSWRALVEDPDVDAIYVATPHNAHYEASMLALRAGKAVLCEKPLTLAVSEAEEMAAVARSGGVFLMEAMWMRCIPAIRRIVELVREGAIGDVVAVHADFGIQGPLPEDSRLRDRKLGGGALYDVGIYPVTFAHLFLGAPATVQAWARMSDGGVDENTGMLFGYDSGAVAALTCSLLGDTPRTGSITGTLGRIDVRRDFFHPQGFTLWRGDEPREFDLPYEGKGYQFEAAEVHRCLREGLLDSPVVPIAETLDILRLLAEVSGLVGLDYSS
ncbi:Gfo/Idh/MocA family oxidoreductase [Dactylosporangium vinaceum]|uniref:Gfo/Idh/MocA family protein n=1 Tax=Dactylosporangium vinaceum TaxID=53362 RepID=A0ABV5M0U7_9ACTN|nr:Gfo/Idh/MocA family oxidoreductase [Dactylosporangium vinaceum]UAB97272.1 Gfo/Idh/MocA family oxidoreductase [Dactylosporangium vinaceum]